MRARSETETYDPGSGPTFILWDEVEDGDVVDEYSPEEWVWDVERRRRQVIEEIETFFRPAVVNFRSNPEYQPLLADAEFRTRCELAAPDFSVINDELLSYLEKKPAAAYQLEWRKFEELIEAVFRAQGYYTELGPGSGDGGVDVRLVQKSSVGDIVVLVQAKRHRQDRMIGLEAVAALYGHVVATEASKGVLVTTSAFQPSARRFAEERHPRLLLAGPAELSEWIRQARLRAVNVPGR